MIITGAAGQPSAGITSGAGGAPGGAGGASGMSASTFAMGAAGVGAIGSILTGLFGYMAGENAQATYESRARMIRAEAENEAQRYTEQVNRFKATQKLSFLKSGVQLSGSPLAILDETIITGHENANAIRASGKARALDAQAGGEAAGMAGRNALVNGVTGAAKSITSGAYSAYANADAAKPRNNTPTGY